MPAREPPPEVNLSIKILLRIKFSRYNFVFNSKKQGLQKRKDIEIQKILGLHDKI